MENLFPDTTSVGPRKGHEAFADGTALFNNGNPFPDTFDTRGMHGLMVWSSGASSKLFAVLIRIDNNTGTPRWHLRIYEVSTTGTFTISEDIGVTAGDPTATIGENLMFVTGSSTPYLLARFCDSTTDYFRAFDGSSWTSPSVTGLPAGNLGMVGHRHRLWFYGKNLTAYYLPIASIAGAVAAFNFGLVFSKGGRIVSMRTWTIDGGDGGSDDLLAILTSNGQMAVYGGTDPTSASTWALVGVYDVAQPASRQSQVIASAQDCIRGSAFMRTYGADLLMLLTDGVASAARVLRPAQGQQDYSISGKINTLLRDAAALYGIDGSATNAGMWSITHHPRLKQLLVNIPTVAPATSSVSARCTSIAYVMNTETGAWTKFTGLDYLDAVVWRGDLYMVAGGYYVYRYGTVNADLAAVITFEARQAYNYLSSPENKNITLMQPVMQWTGNFSLTAEIDVNYSAGTISAYTSYTVSGTQSVTPWLSSSAYGRACAIHMKGQTSVGAGSWYATNIAYKPCTGIP